MSAVACVCPVGEGTCGTASESLQDSLTSYFEMTFSLFLWETED